jgi:hypothetical protein
VLRAGVGVAGRLLLLLLWVVAVAGSAALAVVAALPGWP